MNPEGQEREKHGWNRCLCQSAKAGPEGLPQQPAAGAEPVPAGAGGGGAPAEQPQPRVAGTDPDPADEGGGHGVEGPHQRLRAQFHARAGPGLGVCPQVGHPLRQRGGAGHEPAGQGPGIPEPVLPGGGQQARQRDEILGRGVHRGRGHPGDARPTTRSTSFTTNSCPFTPIPASTTCGSPAPAATPSCTRWWGRPPGKSGPARN